MQNKSDFGEKYWEEIKIIMSHKVLPTPLNNKVNFHQMFNPKEQELIKHFSG